MALARHTRIAALVVLAEFIFIALCIAAPSIASAPRLLFWVQTFAGNWSTPQPKEMGDLHFVGTSLIALLLNFGVLSAIALGTWRILSFQRQTMNTISALLLKDRRVKNELYSSLPSELNLNKEQIGKLTQAVENAFDRGERKWMLRSLPRFMGISAAVNLLASLGFKNDIAREIEQEASTTKGAAATDFNRTGPAFEVK